ncbi:hypothetical protein Taro_010104, partial [Colocasia esculenta]|nr:hypothetical protein [Colocasia esculenta]
PHAYSSPRWTLQELPMVKEFKVKDQEQEEGLLTPNPNSRGTESARVPLPLIPNTTSSTSPSDLEEQEDEDDDGRQLAATSHLIHPFPTKWKPITSSLLVCHAYNGASRPVARRPDHNSTSLFDPDLLAAFADGSHLFNDKECNIHTFEDRRRRFTLGDVKRAIPPHCFQRTILRSFSYVAWDLALSTTVFYVAFTFLPSLPSTVQFLAWPLYWNAQGSVLTTI